jgi:hypothetical protein
MSFHDDHNGFNFNNDILLNDVGFGPDYQEARPEPSTSAGRSTVRYHLTVSVASVYTYVSQTSHEHLLDEFHRGANPANLLSPLYDVDPLPTHDVLRLHNTSAAEAQPEPWDHGLFLNDIPWDGRQHALLNVTGVAGRVTSDGQQQFPGAAPDAEDLAEEHEAHSSINGISQWPDLSVPEEESTEDTSLDLPSASATSSHVCSSCGKIFDKRSGVK